MGTARGHVTTRREDASPLRVGHEDSRYELGFPEGHISNPGMADLIDMVEASEPIDPTVLNEAAKRATSYRDTAGQRHFMGIVAKRLKEDVTTPEN